MGTTGEHSALRHAIKAMREMARDDKRLSKCAFNAWWREHYAKEHRRRIQEAWAMRSFERCLRGQDSASTIMARAKEAGKRQLAESREHLRDALTASLEAAE